MNKKDIPISIYIVGIMNENGQEEHTCILLSELWPRITIRVTAEMEGSGEWSSAAIHLD